MAVYTVANGGGNINAGATYVGGIAPSSTDTIDFTATSGQLTVNANFTIAGIDFTNYVNTLTMSAILSVKGNVTLVAGMTIAGASKLSVNATSTITSNGKTWPNAVDFNMTAASQTVTVADDWNITGTVSFLTNTATFNNNNINVGGSLVMSSSSTGTTQINLIGTGSWSGGYPVKNNLTIKSTAIIDIVGSVQFNTGTFIVEAGAQVNASNSNLTVANTATTTFDISTIKLNNFYLGGASTVNTLQLNSPLYITGTAFLGASSQVQTINGSPIYIESGTLSSQAGNGGGILGTSQIIMTGDKATYLDAATPVFNGQGTWRLPITINVRGTILMYGRLVISTGGTFTILNGTVDHRDGIVNRTSLLIQANTTLTNIDKCKFKNITVTAGVTITMNKFFSGSPEYKSVIRIQGGATNVRVNFTDRAPKKAFFVNLRNFSLISIYTNQLTVINRDGNAGLNQGILFGENGLEGFPINKFPVEPSYSFADGFQTGGMIY